MKKQPRLYFSLRSPFSWMAVRQLEEQVPNVHELVEYIPFWEPDEKSEAALAEQGGEFHYVQMSKAKHLYILQDTKRLAARFGYPMKWPVDVEPWWELPHLAWIMARRHGVHREYYQAVMAARWERGENICDPELLQATVEAAGLDSALLLSAVDDPQIRAEGVRALLEIYHDDVFGVPYFKFGRQRFWGLDRLGDFVAALRAATDAGGAPPSPERTVDMAPTGDKHDPIAGIPKQVLVTTGSADHDTAGGCG
jgi:2-hydroxychromene-2-carboxylate isomerase